MKEQGWEAMTAARLRLLAAADEHEQAPLRVEAGLRAAYREFHAASRRGGWPWVAAWGAIAASVLAFVVFTAPDRSEPAAGPSEESSPAEAPAPPPARLEASPVPGLPALPKTPQQRRYNASVRQAPARELVTEFIPLVYDDTLGSEDTHLVRVRVSRASLASFGLPVDEERDAAARVQADVVMGGDGMARAIRFVREVAVRE